MLIDLVFRLARPVGSCAETYASCDISVWISNILETYDGYFAPKVGFDVAVLHGIWAVLVDDLE